jgi:acyl transferase domain-containing protein
MATEMSDTRDSHLSQAPIAIVGVAGRFPDAENLDQFYENLQRGLVSLGQISPERIAGTALDPSARYRRMGYLEDIDRFDYAFFGMTLGEARTLSPIARLLLQEAWRAFESSGCPPDRFRGSRTDVYMTQIDSVYPELAEEDSSTLFTGNSPDFVVARLNRQFDLRGNAVIVDASCASGVGAVLMSCDALRLGRADYALVCGANLQLFPYVRPSLLETWSPDGQCRSYAADANGMVAGEAAVCLLLTPLARAEANGHLVHAVIRGGALNNNGANSSSPSAPNSVTQAQVMVEAWMQAGVAPHEIGFIEGHGSATQLGDSLEIEALRQAFAGRTSGAPPCALSSVKANIGHGKSMAGLSSIVKAALSVRRGVLFPAPSVRQVNSVLRKAGSPVYVNTEQIRWTDERRLAAVHSFGMNGVNCHVVVENYRPQRAAATVAAGEWFPAPVSGRTRAALLENITALRRSFDAGEEPKTLPDIAHTLSLGRSHFEARRLTLARDIEDLRRAFDELLATPDLAVPEPEARPPRVVMLLSHDPEGVDRLRELSRQLAARFPAFSQPFARVVDRCGSDASFAVAFQLALHQLFGALGVAGALASEGSGKLAALALVGAISEEQALRDADAGPGEPPPDLEQKIAKLVSSQLERGPVVFITMGVESPVSQTLRRRLQESPARVASRVESFGAEGVRSLGDILERLFADGLPLRFEPWFAERQTAPVTLPGYRFARTRCWLRDTPKRLVEAGDNGSDVGAGDWERRWTGASFWERKIAETWREVLGADHFTRDDGLFDLGADSLTATRIVRRLNQELGVRCDFEDIFDRPTIAGLADLVRGQCGVKGFCMAIWRDVLKSDAIAEHSDFFELGGHSLLASEILARVRREFGVVLSFDDFFESPTPARFALILEERLAAKGSDPPEGRPASASDASTLNAAAWSAALRRREMS